jgi:hypothetical protein
MNFSDRYEAMQSRAGESFVVHVSERSPWTKELPTQEGFYWRRLNANDKNPEVRLIVARDGEFRVCHQHAKEYGTDLKLFKNSGIEWAGPFFPPE